MNHLFSLTTFLALSLLPMALLADDASPKTSDAGPVPAAFKDGFKKMGEAMEASAKVFEGLTAEQMNFRPSDGSHTPRWNAEHLRAAQLRFFSAIYHELDPSVKKITAGPKQMPGDYKAANPEWSGEQEAKAMREAQAFCVKHAKLLSDMSPSDKPPASRWPSMATLLNVMSKHYGQHTANVVKKFDDPNWPGDKPKVD